ncbi:MAG: 3'-5' exonuclease, partial [Bacteroidales bacterium]|nr:3'-5' exonuclease [Bacteroidales bacterium]
VLLNTIHHDYSSFSIFTIDSFFQQILRTFSYDLHLPANHQLELDTNVLIKQAVDMVLAKLGHESVLTDFIINYSFRQIDLHKNWKIEKMLQEAAKELYREDAVNALTALETLSIEDFKAIIIKLKAIISIIDNNIKAIATKAVEAMANEQITTDTFYSAKNGIGTWFLKVSSAGMSSAMPTKTVMDTVEQQRWTSKTTDSSIKSQIDKIAPFLTACYNEIRACIEKDYSKFIIIHSVLDNIYPMAMLNEIKKAMDCIKMDEKTMHISETNNYINRIVSNEPVPFIYERLGNRYKYFFIDEFQDTSVLQWQNLLPLICEGLSSEIYANESAASAVFGDAKQAIYRFREGDVRQFNRLPKLYGSDSNPIIRERERILEDNFKIVTLPKNYRSKEEIVSFNNDFFDYMSRCDVEKPSYVSEVYGNLHQSPKDYNTGGGVRLYVIDKKELTDDMSYSDCVLNQLMAILEQILADGYPLSDIAVLCRKNELASFLAEGISQKGVAVISSESLLLKNAPEVNFLLACFNYMLSENNELSRTIILHFLAKENKQVLENLLVVAKKENAFLHALQSMGYAFYPETLKHLNMYELLEHLVEIFGFSTKNNAYVLAFKGVVFDYVQTKANNYVNFLEYWEERGAKFSISNPEGIQAVNILTIHKSKGLQFPVVIYPQKPLLKRASVTKWIQLKPDSYPIEVANIKLTKSLQDTELKYLYEEENNLSALDELNVDYVAYTRAEERLYIIHPTDKNQFSVVNYFKSGSYENESVINGIECYSIGSFDKKDRKDIATMKENRFVSAYTEGIRLPVVVAQQAYESKEMRWGTAMHIYLSYFRKPDDKDRMLQMIAEDNSFTDNEKAMAVRLIENFLKDDTKSLLFGEPDAMVKTEVEIITPDSQSFRIDRLIINKTNCVVIDFKTGSKELSHIKQITHYAQLLKEAAYDEVYSYLMYISNDGDLSIEKI